MPTEQDLAGLEEQLSPWLLNQQENPGVWTVGIEVDAQGQPTLVIGIDRDHPDTRDKIQKRLQGYPLQFREQDEVRALPVKKGR